MSGRRKAAAIRSGRGLGRTSTGQGATASSRWVTLPSSAPWPAERPRLPAMISWAPRHSDLGDVIGGLADRPADDVQRRVDAMAAKRQGPGFELGQQPVIVGAHVTSAKGWPGQALDHVHDLQRAVVARTDLARDG